MIEYATLQPLALPWDERRGSLAMGLFILTEALLFVVLFFAYFYLGHYVADWPPDPPKLTLALIMLAVLLTSSAILYLGERALAGDRSGAARLAVGGTILLGIAFLALQAVEYADRLQTLRPTDSAYGSIFYTITSIHALHLGLGLCMLGYVLLLPELRPTRPPYRPLHNAALYWHFVDAVWVVIIAVLYLLPRGGM
jgi:heme/copper-type cytochrome/quinol oxidase subunit 3